MAQDPKKPEQPAFNRAEQLKTPATLSDPAAKVNDPASSEPTNPGPQPKKAEGPRPMQVMESAPNYVRNQPNQPVVPAPSENVFPGPVGRPDPSRTSEERQSVADAAVEAHNQKPGHMTSFESPKGTDRTSDGEADDSSVPQPKE